MFCDSFAFAQVMSCFGCFGGSERSRHSPNPYDDDTYSHDSGETSNPGGDDEEGEEEEEVEELSRSKRSEEILKCKLQNGLVCRQFPVKETNKLTRGEDEDGNKTINEFVRERKIGSGSYGKVVLYRSTVDDKHYAIKAFHKSHLSRLRVAPSETAMGDVLREVMIMKTLEHPNIVNLIEVIDDPEFDDFYMGISFPLLCISLPQVFLFVCHLILCCFLYSSRIC
jgi:[calcium/calmodulin-dependent protein kinase] kinase